MQVVRDALDWLEDHASQSVLENMGPRYGIHTDKAFGVPMAQMKVLAKRLGTNRVVTAAQMDRWCKDFDNWAICDTVCFNLFDRTPHAWRKVDQWAGRKDEFVKRTAFALLWSLALHDKDAADERFVGGLALIEREAHDDRNFVTKAIAMALRAIGKRNKKLATAARGTAERLAASDDKAARAIGKRAIRELRSSS